MGYETPAGPSEIYFLHEIILLLQHHVAATVPLSCSLEAINDLI
jgi:hypothetical protein